MKLLDRGNDKIDSNLGIKNNNDLIQINDNLLV